MKQRNVSLKVNFIMNAILTLSSFLFPLITFPYISRILLPAGTGKVSF
ncbi:MAG: flippase, partial [Anaerostipes sp.]|nr:flippase [Anaerostipes sp.]